MRSDYALYGVAVVFFILTSIVAYVQMEMRELWIVTTAVLGLLFIGLGYSQRPRVHTISTSSSIIPATEPTSAIVAVSEPIPPTVQSTITEAITSPTSENKEKTIETSSQIVEPIAESPAGELTGVKGIGPKRALQLKAIGINSVEDLSNVSPKSLAVQLKISPKFTEKWIENAKQLVGKS
jgi:predicted flap endonuclease-1-like 5' DNA nuclease